jgi:hypothetical protein
MGRRKNKKPKVKKIIPDKTVEYRLKEAIQIRHKLIELGLSTNIEGIKEFNKKISDWVKNGEFWEGKMPIKGAKKMAIMRLTSKQNQKIEIVLRNWDF